MNLDVSTEDDDNGQFASKRVSDYVIHVSLMVIVELF